MNRALPRSRLAVAVVTIFAATIQVCAAADPTGAWSGSYVCAQGPTALDLVTFRDSKGAFRAEFHFGPLASNPGVPEGCYSMKGAFDPATGAIRLTPGHWRVRPLGYVMIGLVGTVRAGGTAIDGVISPPIPGCTTFSVRAVDVPTVAPAACHAGAASVSVLVPAGP